MSEYDNDQRSDADIRREMYREMHERQQQTQSQQQRGVRIAAERQPLLTYILIGINLAIFALMFLSQEAQVWFLVNFWAAPSAILQDMELHRLVTAMFLHAPDTLLHIAFNMYALYIFGRDVELLFGTRRFAIIYFLGGISGSVLSVTLGDFNVPSIGASGAVFAIWAAQALFVYLHRHLYGDRARAILMNTLFFLGVNLFLGLTMPQIDNWGHIGGFLGGLALTYLIGPRLQIAQLPTETGRLRTVAVDRNKLENNWLSLAYYAAGVVAVLTFAVIFVAP